MSLLPVGCHYDVPAVTYHAMDAASASQLRVIHNSTPAHLKLRMSEPFTPTYDLILGELIHQAILEPHKPVTHLALVPETHEGEAWNWRKKACREWRAAREAEGLVVVTKSDMDEVNRAADAVRQNIEAAELLAESGREVTLRWDDADGLACKARLDCVPASGVLVDLKTTRDASPSGFAKSAWAHGYHLQAAWYLMGWDAVGAGTMRGFKFIAYEKEVGLCKVYDCTPSFLNAGRDAVLRAYETYKRCKRINQWPGYGTDAAPLDVPTWWRGER